MGVPGALLSTRTSSDVQRGLARRKNNELRVMKRVENISLLRHFWHCTFAGVVLDGPARPREAYMFDDGGNQR